MNLIEHLARTRSSHVHPLGEKATDFLLDQLTIEPGCKVLEIGCGVGATAKKMMDRYEIDYFAVEKSREMLRVAIESENVEKSRLHLLSGNDALPFEDDTFDIVISESVLAILEEKELESMLKEIYRVLRPSGVLATNDSIWKDGTSRTRINEVNKICMERFGLIQSNATYAHKEDWTHLFERIGFENEKAFPLLKQNLGEERRKEINWRKVGSFFSLRNIYTALYFKALAYKIRSYGKYIAPYLFILKKSLHE